MRTAPSVDDRVNRRIEKLIVKVSAALNEDRSDIEDLRRWCREMGRVARRLPGDSVKGGASAPTREDHPGGRGKKTSSDRTGLRRGETSSYLAARLKRDHPDICARIEAG
jgi:hypothetical protein